MQHIRDVYNKVALLLSNPEKFHAVRNYILTVLSSIYARALTSDRGYCDVFVIPQDLPKRLAKLLELDIQEVERAFRNDWQYPHADVRMYADPYYQLLFLLVIYGVNNPQTQFAENALTLILMRIWNGRKTEFLKYCDPDIMRYVVNHMVSKSFLVSKYDSPLSLIKDYFVPTILSKYQDKIKRDYAFTKYVLSQCWNRVRQLFVSSRYFDVVQKRTVGRSGLLPLYMKAKEEKLYQKALSNASDEENLENPLEAGSTSVLEDMVHDVVNYMIMNPNVTYPDSFISQVNQSTNVSRVAIKEILKRLHDVKFSDEITDALTIILRRCQVNDPKDVCYPSFFAVLKNKIISSKNNADVNNLKKILDKILTQIFVELNLNYNDYSNVHKIQIRNVVIYGLYYNLRAKFCK